MRSIARKAGRLMNRDTRASLIERLRDGEEPLAWEQFVDAYHLPMLNLARRLGCSDATAQDIVQDAIAAVFENINVFKYDPGKGRFLSWLYKIVNQKFIHHRRRKRPEVGLGGAEEQANGDESKTPDAQFEREFELALWPILLDQARKSVSPATYQAFELVTIHGMSGEEAGRVTGMQPASVYSAKRRVNDKLMELSRGYRESGDLDTTLREAMAMTSIRVRQRITDGVRSTLKG